MIKWCCYCQKYLGDKEPCDDYSITHSMCSDCYDLALSDDGKSRELIKKYEDLKIFYRDIQEYVIEKKYLQARTIVNRAKELNINDIDLLVGVFQPALYQIGKLWEMGIIDVSQEHIFTNTIQAALELIIASNPECSQYRNSPSPKVVISCANNNYHTIGVQMLEIFLILKHIHVQAIFPGIPNEELTAMINKLKPVVLGISISLPFHLIEVENIYNQMKLTHPVDKIPEIVVGGAPVRNKMELSSTVPFQIKFR